MDILRSLVPLTLICGLIFWLRIRPFRERKTAEPETAGFALLTGRRVESGTGGSGRSAGLGYCYLLTFRLENGQELDLFAYETEYGSLRQGTEGILTRKGPYFVSFEPIEKEAT